MNFYIDIKEITEHEDGSATFLFDLNEEAKETLLQYAITDILKKAAQRVAKEQKA